MSEISVEAAREIAAHLSAIMNNPHTPELIKHDIGNRITDMNSTIDQDTPDLIAVALLASQNAEQRWKLAVEEVKHESTLPQLLSDVFNHEDLPEHLGERMWEVFADNTKADPHSPYHFANALGLKLGEQQNQSAQVVANNDDLPHDSINFLANHLSAVLKHDGTPMKLYNAIVEEINDMTILAKVDPDSRGEISKALAIYYAHEGDERKA